MVSGGILPPGYFHGNDNSYMMMFSYESSDLNISFMSWCHHDIISTICMVTIKTCITSLHWMLRYLVWIITYLGWIIAALWHEMILSSCYCLSLKYTKEMKLNKNASQIYWPARKDATLQHLLKLRTPLGASQRRATHKQSLVTPVDLELFF